MPSSGSRSIFLETLLILFLALHFCCPQESALSGGAEKVEAYPAVELPSSIQGRILVTVELARTRAQKERGLMYRKSLDENAGMLFIANYERTQSFWMKNTLIPLDMIFIGSDLTIKGVIENARPGSEKTLSIPTPVKYVLEVNGGFCSKHGIKSGQKVKLHGIEE